MSFSCLENLQFFFSKNSALFETEFEREMINLFASILDNITHYQWHLFVPH